MEELLKNYQPSDDVVELVRTTPIMLLVGVSGAGKDTLKRELLATDGFKDFVSYTTRAPRLNHGVMEQDGIDYHFVDRTEMISLLEKGEMIEAKQYSGNVYGTGAQDLRDAGLTRKVALNDIEVQGVREYKSISSSVHAIFVLPPSHDEWMRRLGKRYEGTDSKKDNIKLRLETSEHELREALSSGYYTFVVNDELSETVRKVSAIAEGVAPVDQQTQARKVAEELLGHISTH